MEATKPTPEQRRDAALRVEAFEAVRDGMLTEDQVDDYVRAMASTFYGQCMALSIAAADLRHAAISSLPRPLRRFFR